MPTQPSSAIKRRRKSPYYYITIILLSFVYLFIGYWLLIGQFYKTSRDAYVSGQLLSVSAQHSGPLTTVFVKENDLVVKGQPIATINGKNAYIAYKNAESNLIAAIQQVKQMNNTTQRIQSQVVIEMKSAQDNLNKAQETYKKLLASFAKKKITAEALSKAQVNVEKAMSTLEEVNIKQNAASSLPIDSNVYQNPIVIEAMDQLRAAYLNWAQSTIYAPDTGYITKREITPGTLVTPNTVLMTMLPLNQIWVNADINQSDLKHIRNGQHVKLISTLYGDKIQYEGTIIGLNSEDSLSTPLQKNHASLRIQVDSQQLAKYPLRYGLALTAKINTLNRKGSTLTTLKSVPILIETQNYREQVSVANHLIDNIIEANTNSSTQIGSL